MQRPIQHAVVPGVLARGEAVPSAGADSGATRPAAGAWTLGAAYPCFWRAAA